MDESLKQKVMVYVQNDVSQYAHIGCCQNEQNGVPECCQNEQVFSAGNGNFPFAASGLTFPFEKLTIRLS
ncbi:MAG: hypothetical protein GY866_36120 [Proteobacteria bacterium]|nr:hypothetical protein [Pseudomonadota bacterium]